MSHSHQRHKENLRTEKGFHRREKLDRIKERETRLNLSRLEEVVSEEDELDYPFQQEDD